MLLAMLFSIIQRGDADIMLAGGTEAAVYLSCSCSWFSQLWKLCLHAMTNQQKHLVHLTATRWFRQWVKVLVSLFLEELEHAKACGAHIYAEVVGYGTNGDAFYYITALYPGGVQARKMYGISRLKMQVSILKPI